MDDQQQDVISRYNAVLEVSERMLEFAEAGDWDNLIEVKREHLVLVETLAQMDQRVPVSDEFKQAKQALLLRICAVDEQLRTRLQARLETLTESIAQTRNNKRVRQAYAGGGAAAYAAESPGTL